MHPDDTILQNHVHFFPSCWRNNCRETNYQPPFRLNVNSQHRRMDTIFDRRLIPDKHMLLEDLGATSTYSWLFLDVAILGLPPSATKSIRCRVFSHPVPSVEIVYFTRSLLSSAIRIMADSVDKQGVLGRVPNVVLPWRRPSPPKLREVFSRAGCSITVK